MKDYLKGYPPVDLGVSNTEITMNYIQDQVFPADVIVYLCNGWRYIYADSSFFGNVFRVVDPRIIEKVRHKAQRYELRSCIGIHLRGTDRATKIDKSHRMAGINIRMMTMGLLNGTKFVGVSDDPEFVAIWKGVPSVLTPEVACVKYESTVPKIGM